MQINEGSISSVNYYIRYLEKTTSKWNYKTQEFDKSCQYGYSYLLLGTTIFYNCLSMLKELT
jgi:hypothetical protein